MPLGMLALVALLILAGLGLGVAGVFLLFGAGWGLIAAGAAVLVTAAILTRGLNG